MINIKDFDSDKNIGFYSTGYITIKEIDDLLKELIENVHSVNLLHLMIDEVIGHIEEKNGNKYVIFDSSDENKEVLKNTKNFGMRLKIKLRT